MAEFFCTTADNDDDLARTLGSSALRIPIPCGDINFSGVDDWGRPVAVVVERKKIGDLCSCILDGRYLFQAQNAKAAGFDVLVLIVEGRIRPSPDDGLLEVPVWGINPRTLRRAEIWQPVKPTLTYSRFDQFLTELDYLVGVMVKRTENVKETASVIKALWDNFQTPPSGHASLHTIFKAPVQNVLLVKPSLVRRVASELPGIGFERSRAVADTFSCVCEMVNADADRWREVDGVGEKTAEKVVKALRGER